MADPTQILPILEPGYVGLMALLFLATAVAVVALYLLLSRRLSLQARLNRLLPAENQAAPASPLLEAEPKGFGAALAKPLGRLAAAPKNGQRPGLRLRLARAGFRSQLALSNYLALKVLLAGALAGGYLASTAFYRISPALVVILLACGACGFFLPDLVLLWLIRRRQRRMERALPDALDLMVVCVEAGLGLDMTFKRVGEEVRPLCRELSDEFHLTTLEIRAGKPRDESFRNMVQRTGVRELGNLVTVLVQTTRFGTSLAKTLRVHADAIRVKRRQLAEQQAAKATVKLIFPLILFIFPALLIVLAGPATIRIFKILLPSLAGP